MTSIVAVTVHFGPEIGGPEVRYCTEFAAETLIEEMEAYGVVTTAEVLTREEFAERVLAVAA